MDPVVLPPPALDDSGYLKIWTIERLMFVSLLGLLLPAVTLGFCSFISPINCEEKNGVKAVEWVEVYLSECIYEQRDYLNFGKEYSLTCVQLHILKTIGYICMMCWSLCLAPQIIVNHVLGKAEDQSFLFYLLWVAGDITNLLGCVLANQLTTQDHDSLPDDDSQMFIGSRTPSFSPKPPRPMAPIERAERMQAPLRVEEARSYGGVDHKETISSKPIFKTPSAIEAVWNVITSELSLAGIIIASFSIVVVLSIIPDLLTSSEIAFITGWSMTLYYTISRVPQILLIARERKVEGLSPVMFIMTFLGNITYMLQVISVSTDMDFLRDKIPWLVQAGLCIIQDMFVLALYVYFKRRDLEKLAIDVSM
ncbi:hypothetical protein AAMO2058_001058300 [Amorphochlora amoebiformis]